MPRRILLYSYFQLLKGRNNEESAGREKKSTEV